MEQYFQLVNKADSFFSDVKTRHSDQFSCRRGCHECCIPGLSVSPIEREAIQNHLLNTPGLLEKAIHLRETNPHQSQRCEFLEADGSCLIYPSRPLVCRTHGAPTQVKQEGVPTRFTCHLNFKKIDLDKLPDSDVLNQDTLNSILYAMNRFYYPGTSEERFPLTLTGILNETDGP